MFDEEQDVLVLRHINKNTEFTAACEDYLAAVKAEQHWRKQIPINVARVREYANLAAELWAEIKALLAAEKEKIGDAADSAVSANETEPDAEHASTPTAEGHKK